MVQQLLLHNLQIAQLVLRNLQIACQSADWHAFCGSSVCATQSADCAEHIYVYIYILCICLCIIYKYYNIM